MVDGSNPSPPVKNHLNGDNMSEKLFKVKKRGEYLWPCKNDQSRKLMVFESDILYRTSPGVFDMTTGLYKKNVHIPEEDIEERNID